MSEPPRSRGIQEMVHALRRHVRLLEDYSHKVFVEGNGDYEGEIAGKLRLLVTKFGSNTPLLIHLMAETGIEPLITLGGPPVYRGQGEPTAGDQVSLSGYLELDAVGIQLPSGDFAMLNKTQFIRAWAEQTGSSHEDWTMDQRLSVILRNQIYIGGIPGALAELKITTETVLHVARQFLNELEG